MNGLEGRLQQLERRMIGGEIICRMADGTERRVRGRRLVAMLGEIGQGVIKDDTKAILECVSDNCTASGNGHMSEAVRVLWFAYQDAANTPEEAERLDAIG